MLLFIAVVVLAVFEYLVLYEPRVIEQLQKYKIPGFRNLKVAANALNEKWGLMLDSLRDKLFNENYNFHVDASPAYVLSNQSTSEN